MNSFILTFSIIQLTLIYLNKADQPTLYHSFVNSHNDIIRRIVFLENGYLASCSNASIKVWDLVHKKLKYTFEPQNGGHQFYIDTLLSLDDGYLASGSGDKTIKIWDIVTGYLKYTFDADKNGHQDVISSLVQLKNGLLISGSYDSKIKVWDLINGKLVYTLSDGIIDDNRVIAMILIDNRFIAASLGDNSIRVWDIENNYRIKYVITDHSDRIFSLAYVEELNYLVSGSDDSTVKVFDLNTGKVRYTFQHEDYVRTLVLLSNGLLASASDDTYVKIWDLKTGLLKFELKSHNNYIRSLLEIQNGYLASGSFDGTIKIWDINSGSLKYTLQNSIELPNQILNLAVLDNTYLASSSSDRSIKIWKINDLN